MTINELKQYITINRKRLAPYQEDCVDSKQYKKVEGDIDTILKTDILAHRFSMDYAKNMFAYGEISLFFYIIACLPFLMFFIPWDGGAQLIYRSSEYKITIGSLGWILYVITFIALVINYFWRGIKKREVFTVSVLLRYALLIACAYFGGIRNITLFGSEFTWFFVALFGGILITLIGRIVDSKRIREESDNYDYTVSQLKSTSLLIKESATDFANLGDKRARELAELFPNVPRSKRTAWYDFKRDYDKRNNLVFPAGRSVETDFTKPFEESTIITKRRNSKRDIETTESIDIYSQAFGYIDITASAAKNLLATGKIYPFFNLEIPEFIEGLQYKLFRHSWHYVKTTSNDGVLFKTREVDSDEQKAFDNYKYQKEYELYKSVGKTMNDLRKEMPQTVAEYERDMAETREKIGSKTEHYKENVNGSYSKESKGDEIGALVIRSTDGELLGLYCGDSLQSIHFAEKIAFDETDFDYSPMISCTGNTQKAFLYSRFRHF